MSDFHELIKNFNKCRDYVRDFFVYGFKSRNDFSAKSNRTYDDERRRIESWLAEYIKTDYTEEKCKNISLQMDSNLLETNPLYRVWKTKSFTDNDIMLHFFLLDTLKDGSMSVSEIADSLLQNYEVIFDPQMIRRKCNEYVKEGLLAAEKTGKTMTYRRQIAFADIMMENSDLLAAISFYHLAAPFGFIGSTILDQQKKNNFMFRIKHSFLVHTLEDEMVSLLLQAMRNKQEVCLFCQSNKNQEMRKERGVPLQFFSSTRTGRRYILVYRTSTKRFLCHRLDQIKKIELLSVYEEYDCVREKLEQNKSRTFGVSFQNQSQHREQHLKLLLHIDEINENYILKRLEREGKGGTITRVDKDTFLYEKTIFDAHEMLPWLRTFTGRILSVETEQRNFQQHFLRDLESMYKMYEIE